MRGLVFLILSLSCFGANLSTLSTSRVLAFEARKSEYVWHGAGGTLSVTSQSAVLNLGGRVVRMSAVGASPESSLEGLDRMPGKANYMLGRDVRTSYDLYGRVRRRDVYPDVDMVFRGNQERLEYDFEIGAGSDPAQIRLAFDGIDEMEIDRNGDLVLRAGAVTIQQPKPLAYQVVAGQTQPVEAAYWIDGAHHVRFRIGVYDRRRPLVIDPQIVFDKVFGGSADNYAVGLARDAQGGLYVAGVTNSTDFPTMNPVQSHLATAPLLVSADGGKTWSLLSLGAASSVFAIAVAPSAPTVLYASTTAGIFKSTDGGTSWAATTGSGLAGVATILAVDASSATTIYAATANGIFVSTDGAASWRASTNGITGTNIDTIAVSPTQTGTVFASTSQPGLFRSTDFGQTWTRLSIPELDQRASALVILFSPSGSIILGTPIGIFISSDGGNTWTGPPSLYNNQSVDNPQALAIAPTNPSILYLVNETGLQESTDGGQTFTPLAPSIHFSPFARLAVDPRNPTTVYVTDGNLYRSTDGGQTFTQLSLPYSISAQTIFVSPADSRVFLGAYTHNNVFITKWSADGSQILYSTYLGGSGSDGANAIAVDGSGSAYVTGGTSSPDFPTTSGAFQTKLTSMQDVFVTKLSPDGSKLIYSTLLGSTNTQPAGIAVDSTGDAVIAGRTQGAFPVTGNAFQTAPEATCNVQIPLEIIVPSGDAFVTKIAPGGNALIYSTLLGGNCGTYGNNVALDAAGNAWVAGSTISTDFPVTNDALQSKPGGGYYDGFLARFNPAGGLDYATYVGGQGYDSLNAIAFDATGNIYLAGESGGLLQPASPGAFQPQANASCPVFSIGPSVYSVQGNGLVLKLDPAAHSILRLTYLGAPSCLSPSSIAVDAAGEPWIAGAFGANSTLQTANPLRLGIGQGYLAKFSADFTQLLFSTYFDAVAGLALDPSGFAYAAGTTAFSGNAAEQAYIAKIDPTPAAISLNSIVSVVPSVSPNNFQGIAPGEVLRILGARMGPASAAPGMIVSGVLASTVAGVQVTFDGVPAPLLSVSAQEIDLVTPFELAGKSTTTVQVVANGVRSNAVQVGVMPTAVQILGVFNGDLSPNSASNPAKPGSVMILYIAGAGQTNPPSVDGQINTAPFAAPAMPIQVEWQIDNPNGTTVLPVTFAGAAPDLAAGIFQINFIAPQQSVPNLNLVVGSGFYASFSIFIQSPPDNLIARRSVERGSDFVTLTDVRHKKRLLMRAAQ